MAKVGNLKLDFKSIGIHFFEFEEMFRCYRDDENLKKYFGHMDTLTLFDLGFSDVKLSRLGFNLLNFSMDSISEKRPSQN